MTVRKSPVLKGILQDALLVAAAAAVLTGLTLLEGQPPLPPGLPALIGLSIAVALPVLMRRKLPLTAAACSAGLVLFGLPFPSWPGRLLAMAMFGVAAYRSRRLPWPVLLVSVLWAIGYGLLLPKMLGLSVITDLIIMGTAPVAIGYTLRLHGDRAQEAIRLHQAEARRDIAEKRARLAQDVHDSVGHYLTAIHMQATATRRALRDLTPTGDRALGTIADLSSSALSEVRTLLKTLAEEFPDRGPGWRTSNTWSDGCPPPTCG